MPSRAASPGVFVVAAGVMPAQGAQSSVMADNSSGKYWWCLKHNRVEQDPELCKWSDRLGPYDTEGQAQQALALVEERNRQADAEDEQ